MKKLIIGLFIFVFLAISSQVQASSAFNDALLKIQSLVKEVEQLKAKLGASSYYGGTDYSGSSYGSGYNYNYNTGANTTPTITLPSTSTSYTGGSGYSYNYNAGGSSTPTSTTTSTTTPITPTPYINNSGYSYNYNAGGPIVTPPSVTNVQSTCTDSDSSPNMEGVTLVNEIYQPSLFTKGIAKGKFTAGSSHPLKLIIGEDFANSSWVKPSPYDYTIAHDYCSNNSELKEFYCSNGEIKTLGIGCPNGCSNGACNRATVVTAPSITVLSPGENNSFLSGNEVSLSWASKGVQLNEVVDVSYSSCNDGSCTSYWIKQGLNPIGGLSWKANVDKGFWFINFDLRSKSGAGSYTLEKKSVRVYVGPSNNTPSIKVLSPNGGEVYQVGQQITVKWKTENVPTDKKIRVYLSYESSWSKNQGFESDSSSPSILFNTLNDGIETWDIDSSVMETLKGNAVDKNDFFGKSYKIKIYYDLPDGKFVSDISDNSFTIKPVTVIDTGCSNYEVYSSTTGQLCQNNRDPYVKLVYPQTGSTFKAGQNVEIKVLSNLTRQGAFKAFIYRKNFNGSYVPVNEYKTANVGVQTIQIPFFTPDGEYKISYGHTFGVGDYTEYGSAVFYITSDKTIDRGCLNGARYSYTTGKLCPKY